MFEDATSLTLPCLQALRLCKRLSKWPSKNWESQKLTNQESLVKLDCLCWFSVGDFRVDKLGFCPMTWVELFYTSTTGENQGPAISPRKSRRFRWNWRSAWNRRRMGGDDGG